MEVKLYSEKKFCFHQLDIHIDQCKISFLQQYTFLKKWMKLPPRVRVTKKGVFIDIPSIGLVIKSHLSQKVN